MTNSPPGLCDDRAISCSSSIRRVRTAWMRVVDIRARERVVAARRHHRPARRFVADAAAAGKPSEASASISAAQDGAHGGSHRARGGIPHAPVVPSVTWSNRPRRLEPLSPPGHTGQYPKIVNNPGANPALTRRGDRFPNIAGVAIRTFARTPGWLRSELRARAPEKCGPSPTRPRKSGCADDHADQDARRPALPYRHLRLRPGKDGGLLLPRLRAGRDRPRPFQARRRHRLSEPRPDRASPDHHRLRAAEGTRSTRPSIRFRSGCRGSKTCGSTIRGW